MPSKKLIATNLHERIPLRYYSESIKKNPLQRFWHTHRFENISQLVDPVKGEILDIGCADGTFTKVLIQKAKPSKTTGIDIVKNLIEDNRKRFKKERKVKFVVADAAHLPFERNRFDAVFCLEVLEHLPHPEKAISEMKRVLRPGGYLVILVPTDSFLFKVAWNCLALPTWGKIWQDTHIQSFCSTNTLADFLRKNGFNIIENKFFLWGMLNAVKARK